MRVKASASARGAVRAMNVPRAPSCKINRHPLGDARPMPFVNVLPHRHEDDDVIVAREGLLDLALFGEVEHIAGHMRL